MVKVAARDAGDGGALLNKIVMTHDAEKHPLGKPAGRRRGTAARDGGAGRRRGTAARDGGAGQMICGPDVGGNANAKSHKESVSPNANLTPPESQMRRTALPFTTRMGFMRQTHGLVGTIWLLRLSYLATKLDGMNNRVDISKQDQHM